MLRGSAVASDDIADAGPRSARTDAQPTDPVALSGVTTSGGPAAKIGGPASRHPCVVIVRDRPSSGGGVVNYYSAVAPYLEAEVVFSDVGRPHGYYEAVASHLLHFTAVRLMWDWGSLAGKILRHRPDMVHVNPSLDPTTCRSLIRDAVNVAIAKLLRTPVLVFWRGFDADYSGRAEFPRGNHSWMARLYRSADAQVVLATRFKQDLERWGFTRPIHVETTVASDDVMAAGQAVDIESRPRTNLLYLSRVEVDKGIFTLIHAYALLKQQRPDVSLTIAGDGPALPAAKALVEELRVADVAFPGFVSGSAKLEHYRRASVFCFPSPNEGMPNAVLEAMAMGLPLVCSDAGGLDDVLTDGVNGFVLRRGPTRTDGHYFDPATIAAHILRLTGDEALYRRMARANREYAQERFGARTCANRLTNIYVDVLSRTGKLNALGT